MTQRITRFLLPAIVPALLVALWWMASAGSTSIFFPPLAKIWQRFHELWIFDLVGEHVVSSLNSVLIGLGISIVLGVGLGIVLGLNDAIATAVGPLLQFMRYLPAVAMLPLAIQLMGIGPDMRVLIVVLGALWPVLLNTIDGVRGVHPALVDVASPTGFAQSTGSSGWSFSASPRFSQGSGEPRGFGHPNVRQRTDGGLAGSAISSWRPSASLLPEMWSGMILLGVIGYLLNVILLLVERFALDWHRESRS
jgi:ABC-type nitrate/sulfonate/bicarbonate transport system permease component